MRSVPQRDRPPPACSCAVPFHSHWPKTRPRPPLIPVGALPRAGCRSAPPSPPSTAISDVQAAPASGEFCRGPWTTSSSPRRTGWAARCARAHSSPARAKSVPLHAPMCFADAVRRPTDLRRSLVRRARCARVERRSDRAQMSRARPRHPRHPRLHPRHPRLPRSHPRHPRRPRHHPRHQPPTTWTWTTARRPPTRRRAAVAARTPSASGSSRGSMPRAATRAAPCRRPARWPT